MKVLCRLLGLSCTRLSSRCSNIAARLSSTLPLPSVKRRRSSASQHDSLGSFESHAQAVDLSPTSTVYIGTRYEYLVQSSLARLGFTLTRTGGASDLGIDLRGTWKLPSGLVLPTVVQCKAYTPSPTMIRELAGVGREGEMRFLAARGQATRGIVQAVQRSRMPMAFVNVDGEGRVKQAIWNAVAEENGLLGLGAALRLGAKGDEEVIWTWQGKVVKEKTGD